MTNITKVVDDIKNDGKYDAILDVVKKNLKNDNPNIDEIKNLVEDDAYYISEYKDLNRWGELSSVHLNELKLSENDALEAKVLKEQINAKMIYLKNSEEYEIKQKNVIYMAWTFFIALPSIYVIDNLVRITGLYDGNEYSVFISFLLVIVASIWGYMKVASNHKSQHKKYMQTQVDTKLLIKNGLEKEFFSEKEVYLY